MHEGKDRVIVPLFKVYMNPNAGKDVEKTLASGMITQGPKVEEFEKKLREYFNYPYILTLNSATSGLTLALRLLNLPADTIVLSCPLTCTATNWPILFHNLSIKWVDVDPGTCNIDLDDAKKKITRETRVIVIVHWGGYPVDLDKVNDLKIYARETYGTTLHIIEDCAHAFGAKYKEKNIGVYGNNICVFSLQAIKHLTTGDGGLIFLPNEELFRRAKLLRWFGIDREKRSGNGDFRMEPDIAEWGYKFHMNDIQATIGLSNLPCIEDNLRVMRLNYDKYHKELGNLKNVKLLNNDPDHLSACWLFTIRILNGLKNEFMRFMTGKKIMVSQVHQRNDIHSCVEKFKSHEPLHNLDFFEKEIVCIPVGWWVTDSEHKYIVEHIKEFDNLFK